MFIANLFEAQNRPVKVIYPGRFQPFHKGHAAVYNHLVSKYGLNNVFIVTSDKQDGDKSPFSFEEKKRMMMLTGIDTSHIVMSTQPYQAKELVSTFTPDTVLLFAVSAKDMAEDPRFQFAPKKDGSASYFQPFTDIKQCVPFAKHAYMVTVPTFDFTVLGKPANSASQIRAQFGAADEETQKKIVADLFGKFDHRVYTIMRSKLVHNPAPVTESAEALDFATNAHAGQTRSGGDAYITHPVRVAAHIEKHKKSQKLDALINAALLHDTVEDTNTTYEDLETLFGGLVASLVKELTSDSDQIQAMGKANYLAHKMANMSSYALVIKLADRLDNVKDIATAKTPAWREKYKNETLHILDHIESNRKLSKTHRVFIDLIRKKLNELNHDTNSIEETMTITTNESANDAEYFDNWHKWDQAVRRAGGTTEHSGGGRYSAIWMDGEGFGVWDENTGEGYIDFEQEQPYMGNNDSLGEDTQVDEARGDTIEAHGIRGMKRQPWRRSFKDYAAMEAWCEKYDAEVYGTRDTDAAAQGKLAPAVNVDEAVDDTAWHGSNTDMSWYDSYKNNPVRVKVKNHSRIGSGVSGTFTIRSFKKVDATKAELVINTRNGEMTATVDLDNPQTVLTQKYDRVPAMDFYSGQMPITARQAFNLFQHRSKKPAAVEEEQVNELSTGTLNNYVGKAKNAVPANLHQASNRIHGIMKAKEIEHGRKVDSDLKRLGDPRMQTEGKKGTSAHAKEVAAKSKKYYDNEALKREKSGETYNVGNAKVTKPAVKESGLGGVPWGMQNEGRFTHGTGGVPLDRRGNPIPPKVKEPRAPAGPRRDSNGLTKDDYSKVWRKIEDVVSNIFPDGDPIDWLAPWLNRSGVRDHHVGEVLEKACKMNGYADVYAYYDSFKTADYGWNEGVTEGVEQKVHPSSLGQFLYYALLVNLNDISSPYREGTPEYEEFAEAFRHAFADQNRRYLRLHNDLATLARVFNIPNYEKYLQNANKQGVKEGYDGWGEKEVTEASPDTTINLLKGLKSWQVVIRNNYYNGKYSDYSGRYYYVIASSPEEAKEVVLDNADGILQDLLTKKSNKGKKILPRGSAIPITDKQIGDIKDGTVSGRMSTMGFVKLFSPQGPIMVKLAGGQIDDVQGQEQGIEEDAVDDYFARGGKATVGKYHNPRKVEAPGFGSKHIGSGSGRGTTKGQVSGLKANTHPNGGKPVVTAGKQVDNTKQVNELSAETLNKYASAANRNRSEVSAAHSAEGKWDPKIVDKMDRRADSSMKAYNKANAQKGQS